MPLLLSIPEVAAELSLSKDFVWLAVSDQRIPSVRCGSRRLIHRDVVARLAQEGIPGKGQ